MDTSQCERFHVPGVTKIRNMIRICPSILNVDRANLVGEIAKITQSSDLLHLDIMDNKFVPNFTFTLLESEKIIKNSLLPVDAHLMVEQPESEIPHYLNFGCASVTFHFEATQSPNQCIELIKSSNKRVGMAIKPRTNFSEISNFLNQLDMLLIMTVEPGFGGQKFMSEMMDKVKKSREFIGDADIWLQVDGGISLETIEIAREAGADTFVAGSAVFKSPDPADMVLQLKKLATR